MAGHSMAGDGVLGAAGKGKAAMSFKDMEEMKARMRREAAASSLVPEMDADDQR
jgi:hypothetical protein